MDEIILRNVNKISLETRGIVLRTDHNEIILERNGCNDEELAAMLILWSQELYFDTLNHDKLQEKLDQVEKVTRECFEENFGWEMK